MTNPAPVERRVRLSADRAARLQELASTHHLREDDVIERALDLLFDQEQTDKISWEQASEASLERVWDNDADAAYDDWRGLYGIPGPASRSFTPSAGPAPQAPALGSP